MIFLEFETHESPTPFPAEFDSFGFFVKAYSNSLPLPGSLNALSPMLESKGIQIQFLIGSASSETLQDARILLNAFAPITNEEKSEL